MNAKMGLHVFSIFNATLMFCTELPAESAPPPPHFQCEQVVASGKDWTSMKDSFEGIPPVNAHRLYKADASCTRVSDDYFPTGGGFAYDGSQHEAGFVDRWKRVGSFPHDRTWPKSNNTRLPMAEGQPAKSWRCVALDSQQTRSEPPSHLWCIAVCCKWAK